MNVTELVMHPAQLTHVETVRFHAEKKSQTVGREFNVEASTEGEHVDEKTGKSHIRIKVYNDDFWIEEEKVGVFEFGDEISDPQTVTRFMEVQGLRILWSYVREDLYSITAKMLEAPIMLPTIDVLQTVEKAQ